MLRIEQMLEAYDKQELLRVGGEARLGCTRREFTAAQCRRVNKKARRERGKAPF